MKSFSLRSLLLVILPIFFLLGFIPMELAAEGTKQTTPSSSISAGQTIQLQINRSSAGGDPSTFAGWTATSQNDRMFIRIGNYLNEKVYLGFQKEDAGQDVYFRIKRPDGTVVYGPTAIPTSGAGYISGWSNANVGPSNLTGNSGGYNGLLFDPNANANSRFNGDFYIEFNTSNSTANNDMIFLQYYDITVANGTANTNVKEGRLWSYNWGFNSQGFSNPCYGSLYAYTPDSVVTEIDLNGLSPYYFRIFCNTNGPRTGQGISGNRKSVNGTSGTPEHRLFLNDPDPLQFPSAVDADRDVTFNGISGCGTNYCFNITIDGAALTELRLDLNNNGVYTDAVDRTIEQNVTTGSNCLLWDGKDGQGNTVSPSNTLKLTLFTKVGITHLPEYDAENNPNGFLARVVRPTGVGTITMYYDNSLVSGSQDTLGSVPPAPLSGTSVNTNGINKWTGDFGDMKTINTWWLVSKTILNNHTFNKPSCSDLGITKTDGSATYTPGTNVVYTIVASNSGSNTATGAVITDNAPVGTTITSWTAVFAGGATGTASGSGNISQTINIPVGATATYTVTLAVPSNKTGNLVNTVTIAAPVSSPDPNSANNTATDTDTQNSVADLAVVKTSSSLTPNVGSNITFTITATNNGPSNAVGVNVTDNIPSGYTLVSATPGSGTWSAPNWSIGNLANGGTAILTVVATVNASGTYANTASITGGQLDPNLTNNISTVTPVPVAQSDLVVVKTINNANPLVGTNITFTITASNNGPGNNIGVIVNDAIPAGYSVVTVTPSIGTWSAPNWNIGNFANGASATLTVVATVNATGSYTNTATISGSVTDPNLTNNTSSVTPDVDFFPIANWDAATTNEDAPISGTVVSNDVLSGDGGNVWTLVTGPTNGSVVVNANGTYTYTPNANYNGPDNFIYKICDVDNDCDTAIVRLTISPLDDAPIANWDAATTNEDAPISGTVVSNDVLSDDGGNVWTLVTGPTNGSVVVNANGTYTYTPNANYNGPDNFIYQICDVDNDCDTAIVRLTISPLDDAPIANWDAATTNEDAPISGTVVSNDVLSGDGGNVWTLVTGPTNGSVVVNANGTYTYTPNANYNGPDNFIYKICDVDNDCDTAIVRLTISPLDDAPIANWDAATTNEDAPISGTVVSNDVLSGDGGNVWTLVTGPTNGSVVVNANGTYTYTPNANYNGPDNFIYQICDVDNDCDTAIVRLTISPLDDAPIANWDAATTNEDAPISGTVVSNDVLSGDGGNVWTLVTGPTNGSVVVNANGTYTYTPNANYNGPDNFIYQICDVDNDCDTAIVRLTISPIDDAPIANWDAATTNEDAPISGTVVSNDVLSGDGGNVWTLVTGPTNGSVVVNANGTYTYTPNANYNGPDNFIYKICDVDNDCDTAIVRLTISPLDDAPIANWDAATTNEDAPISGTVVSNDVLSGDGGNVWTLVTGPTNGSVVVNANGTYTYTPNANYNGPDNFIYQICDVDNDCDTAIVRLTISPIDDAPIANWDAATTNEDAPISGTVVSNDVLSGDGGNVWTLVTGPTNGSVVVNANGTYTYTPNANYNGPDNFIYKICDVDNDCDTAIVRLTISPLDDAPIANWDAATTNEDAPISGTVVSNDVLSGDGGNVWTLVTGPTNGSVVVNANGTYTYTPNANYNGPDNFIYQICDVDNDCDTAIVRLTISPIDDAPIANWDAATTNEDAPISGTVVSNDVLSGDGGNVWTLVTGPTNGSVVVNANGTYTYTPNANYNGPDNFIYKICDVDNDCDTAIVRLTISPLDDAPIANWDAATTNEDAPISGTVVSNDVLSGDGGNVWTLVTGPTNGSVVVNANGTYTYTPNANYNGPDNFIYKICDVDNDCDTAIVRLTISPVCDLTYSNTNVAICEGSCYVFNGHSYTTAGTYVAMLTNVEGCDSAATLTLSVNPAPSADFGINHSEQCLTGNNYLVTMATPQVGVIYTYNFGDGYTASGLATSHSHSYATAGTYKIMVTAYSSSLACSSVDSMNVIVGEKPTVSLWVNDTAQCVGGNLFAFFNYSTAADGYGLNQTIWTPSTVGSTPGTIDVAAVELGVKFRSSTNGIVKGIRFYKLAASSGTFVGKLYTSSGTLLGSATFTTTPSGWQEVLFSSPIAVTANTTYVASYYTPNGNYAFDANYFGASATVNGDLKALKNGEEGGNGVFLYGVGGGFPTGTFNAANYWVDVVFAPAVAGSVATTYFDFGDGNDTTTIGTSPVTHHYAASGVYYVKAHVTSSTACTSVDSIRVNALPGPIADFTISQLNCCGEVQVTNLSQNARSYEWEFRSVGSSYVFTCTYNTNNFIVALNPGTYYAKLVAHGDGDCVDTLEKMITILPKPNAVFSPVVNACGTDVAFNNYSFGSITYAWNFGDVASGLANTSTIAEPNHLFTAPGTYMVTLIATNAGNCSDTMVRTVIVNPSLGVNPIASFTFAPTTTSCAYKVRFSNTSTNTASVLWLFADGTSSNANVVDKTFATAGIYTVKMVAISSTGCVDTASQQVMIISNTNGPMASFEVMDNNQCLKGNSFNFINTSVFNGSGWIPSYSWNFGDGTYDNVNSFAFNKVYATAGTYTVTLIATGSNGCKDTAYAVVVVKPSPAMSFMAGNTCKNNVTFTNTTVGSIGNYWNMGDGGIPCFDSTNFSHTYSKIGWYDVQLISVGENGCFDTLVQGVGVNNGPSPVAGFTYSVETCSKVIKFENTSTGGGVYTWNFGDSSPLDTTTAPFHGYSPAGTYLVTLTASIGQGCSNSITLPVVAPQWMGVYSPIAKFEYGVEACTNTITATGTSTGVSMQQWLWDGSVIAWGPNVTIPNPEIGGHLLLYVVGNGVCTDTLGHYFHIQGPTEAGFDLVSSTCSNTIQVFNTSKNANTYVWNFGDPSTLADTTMGAGASYTYANNGTFTVQLIATDLYGCTDTLEQAVTVTRAFNPYIASFTYDNSLCNCRCQNAVKFINTTPGSNNIYLWTFGDGSSSIQTNANKGFGAAGVYQVTLTSVDSAGCMSSVTKPVTIVEGLKGPSASFNTDYQVQCIDNNSFNFYNTSSYMGSGWNTKYYWNFGDGTTDTTNTFVFNKKYTTPGNYVVSLVALSNEGCKDTMTMYIQVRPNPCTGVLRLVNLADGSNWNINPEFGGGATTGIAKLNQSIDMGLYPNPNDGNFAISFNERVNEAFDLEIRDMAGRVVYQRMQIENSPVELSVSTNDLAGGAYVLRVVTLEGRLSEKKFIVVK